MLDFEEIKSKIISEINGLTNPNLNFDCDNGQNIDLYSLHSFMTVSVL